MRFFQKDIWGIRVQENWTDQEIYALRNDINEFHEGTGAGRVAEMVDEKIMEEINGTWRPGRPK